LRLRPTTRPTPSRATPESLSAAENAAAAGVATVLSSAPRPGKTERLVFVVGGSGSGKSSIVRAGVLPALKRPAARCVVVPAFSPEGTPLEKLARSVARAFGEFEGDLGWRSCHERLARGGGALVDLARDLLDAAGLAADGSVVITVDQAEQLATGCARQDRIDFLNLLAAALDGPGASPLWVLATLRSEYLTELVAGTALEGHAASTIPVSPLSQLRLAEVIAEPARRAGIQIEPALVDRMVAETRAGTPSGGDPLPLLAFTLRQLYEERPQRTRITEDDYDRVGGVVGALQAEAERVYEQLAKQGRGDDVVPALLELVHAEADREPTARSVRRDRFEAERADVVDAFVEARLLTSEGDDPVVTVAHEALLREWPLLALEIENARDDLQARSRLERDAREWARAGRDPSYLTGGVRLEAARKALAAQPDAEAGLGEVEREFFQASVAHEEQQRRAARRRVRLTIGGLVAALLLISVGAILAFWQSGVAADERDAARSRELAIRAMSQLALDPTDSVRLAAEAVELAPTAEAEQALRAALAESYSRAILRGHRGQVLDAAFDRTGEHVVTAGSDGTARIWNAASGRNVRVLAVQGRVARTAAFDPEGKRVVTADDNAWNTVRIWDVATGRLLAVLPTSSSSSAAFVSEGKRVIVFDSLGNPSLWNPLTRKKVAVAEDVLISIANRVYPAAFLQPPSPGGGRHTESPVVTLGARGSAKVTDAVTGKRLAVLRGHKGTVSTADFDPRGERLVTTASEDTAAHVWDVATWEPVTTLRGHTGSLFAASFGPDATRVVTASRDGTARVWELETGNNLADLRSESRTLDSATFDSEGRHFVTADDHGTLQVRDTATGKSLAALHGAAGIVGAAFDREGKRVVAAGDNHTAAVWDTATGKRLVVLRGHSAAVSSAVFDRDGNRILTASADDTARIWDAATGKTLRVLHIREKSHEDWASPLHDLRATFDPAGKRVLTTLGATLRLWDAGTGESLAIMRGHTNLIRAAAFDPDGKRVVSEGLEGTVRIWDAATGQSLAVLQAHLGEHPSVEFDPRGNLIVTPGADGARAWEVATGRLLIIVGNGDGPIVSAAFAADGTQIVTAGKDGTVRFYACRPCGPIDKLLKEARRPATFEPAQELDVQRVAIDEQRGTLLIYACRPCGGARDRVASTRKTASFERVRELLIDRFGLDEHEDTVRIDACRPCDAIDRPPAFRDEVLERVQEVLVAGLGAAKSEVTENASLEEDLDADELDRLELVMEIEDQFGVRISDEQWEHLATVGQVVDFITHQR
jgi:acyl carrier protein